METKKCTKCQVEYPIEHFSKKGSGRNTRCSACVADYFRNYYHNNPDRREAHKARVRANKEKNWLRDLAKKYNTTENHIQELLKANGGLCAICKIEPSSHIDHCHDTGVVRGALCRGCNVGLGNFRDDIVRLAAAIEYLTGVSPLADIE